MTKKDLTHAFSVEMNSRDHMRRISFSDCDSEPVLIEGYLGGLRQVELLEDSVLMVAGENGTLRLDLTFQEIRILSTRKSRKDGDHR
jgi:hypothetical protein